MSEATFRCTNHPERETGLRCNRCKKPICAQCAVRTPVGYRCKECIRGQQAIFETAHKFDFAIAGVLAAVGVGLVIAVLKYLGFWGLIVAPLAGGALARLVQAAIGRRRSKKLPLALAIGGVVGVVPHLFLPATALFASLNDQLAPPMIGRIALAALWPIGYGFLIISTMIASLRSIRLS